MAPRYRRRFLKHDGCENPRKKAAACRSIRICGRNLSQGPRRKPSQRIGGKRGGVSSFPGVPLSPHAFRNSKGVVVTAWARVRCFAHDKAHNGCPNNHEHASSKWASQMGLAQNIKSGNRPIPPANHTTRIWSAFRQVRTIGALGVQRSIKKELKGALFRGG